MKSRRRASWRADAARPPGALLAFPLLQLRAAATGLPVSIADRVRFGDWPGALAFARPLSLLAFARRNVAVLLTLLLATVAFYLVVGPRVLLPSNIAWLGDGDPAQQFIGWHFFRNCAWSFPVGLNACFGLEFSNAIVYSDSVPGLALLLKPFSAWLPPTFQYTGLWIYTCFVLQAWLGFKLAGLFTPNTAARLFSAGLFVFTPALIWRLSGHFALVGHFLILWALYLALRTPKPRQALWWGLLLVSAALVHAYLLAIVTVLWVADLADRVVAGERWPRAAALESLGAVAAVGLACWQAGYFTVPDGVSIVGFGFYRLNVLSPFDPSGWSYLLKDLPETEGDYEGFNYLGLGVIFLCAAAAAVLAKQPSELLGALRRHPFVVLALVALVVFALSNKVVIGASPALELELPESIVHAANIFRSSGRMFWPVGYALLAALIYLIVLGYGRMAPYLLGVALLVQAADTSAGWLPTRAQLMVTPSDSWPTVLKHDFWEVAGPRYRSVRWIMPDNCRPEWRTFAGYAARHGMTTDSAYLSRVDKDKLKAAQAKANATMAQGSFDPHTLYIVDQDSLIPALKHINLGTDLLAEIDGFNVIAPNWKTCPDCQRAARVQELFAPLRLGREVWFSRAGRGSEYLVSGWSRSERWGVWSNGTEASLLLPVADVASTVVLRANPLVSPTHPSQTVLVEMNGYPTQFKMTEGSHGMVSIPIPAAARQSLKRTSFLRLDFKFADAARPIDIGLNSDTRRLAIGLVGLTLN